MTQDLNSHQFFSNMLLIEMFAVSDLQSAALQGDESAALLLPARTQSLANISATIAHLNKGDVTKIDTDSLNESWLRSRLENSVINTTSPDAANAEGIEQ